MLSGTRSRGLLGAIQLFAVALCLQAAIDRGSIQGTITDQLDAVVSHARIVVKNVDTNVEVVLVTNSVGFYLAPELVPGTYAVHIEASGFSPTDITNIKVTAGTTITADAHLQVGATAQKVEVSAFAPLIEQTPSNFSTAVETRYIQDVALPGRDIQNLVQLVPGITQSVGPPGTLFGFNSEFAGFPDPSHIIGSAVSANGGQSGANAWYLDGSLNLVQGAENVAVNPSPDAVAEFNVINNGLAAEYSFTGGAVINVVLRSGTNTLHGDAYEFNRNSYFNATNPFARRDPQGKPFLAPRVNSNNFGGTLGGPVTLPKIYQGKNKTFFFVSWDVALLHENIPKILTVPIGQEKLGDFRGDPRFAANCNPAAGVTNCLYDPYSTTGPDANGLFHRTPYPTPVIPANRIDPVAAFYANSFPDPNFVDPLQQGSSGCGIICNNYFGATGSGQTTHNASVKIDHGLTEKHKLFVEWLYNPISYTNFRFPWNGPTAQTQTGVGAAQPYDARNQIAAVGLTSTLTPTLVNEARINFSRQAIIPYLNSDSVTATSQVLKVVQGLNLPLDPKFSPAPLISGGSDLGSFGPQAWQNGLSGAQAITILDSVTKVLNKHILKAGFMFRKEAAWYVDQCPVSLNFYGGLTSDPVSGQGGSSLAQFLSGAVDQGSYGCLGHNPWLMSNSYSMYGQDDFRITPKLTVSFGLHYDIMGWPKERYNDGTLFNFKEMNPQVPFRGRLDYLGSPQHPSGNIFPALKSDLGPRVSFAWSATQKTVIRGGYGIIYSNAFGTLIAPQNNIASGTGFGIGYSYNGDFTGRTPAFELSQGAPPPLVNTPPANQQRQQDYQFLGSNVSAFFQGSKDPYVQQYNLSIQRALPANMMLSVGYVGTHGLHLIGDSFRNVNYVPTAIRLSQRNNLNLPIPTDASLGPLYGCPADPNLPGKVDCAANLVLRPYPEYGAITEEISPDGFNRYNSLQAKFEKRYSNGLNIIAAYTFQKNIDSVNLGALAAGNISPTTFGNRALGRSSFVRGAYNGSGVENPDNRRQYTAIAPDDIPQVLNIVAVYELPFGKGKPFLNRSGSIARALGGWTLTQNWNFQSGVPLAFSSPCNAISCTPNLIGNPTAGRGSKSRVQLENQYFNPGAFQAPFGSDPAVIQEVTTGLKPDGTPLDFNTLNQWWVFGNSGYRLPGARAPGFWGSDVTLSKAFHVTEHRYFEFRWELLNAFNHQNLGIPNTNWCLPPNPDGSLDAVHVFGCQFGKITNVQTDPRSMQFALKFYF